MSEYGPILDSNNPLSLNTDNPDQGIVIHDNKSNCLSSLCNLFVVPVIASLGNTSNNNVVSLLTQTNSLFFFSS